MNEEEPAEKIVVLAEALNCADMLLDFLDQEEDSKFTQILTLRELRTSINLKRQINIRQRVMMDFFRKTP